MEIAKKALVSCELAGGRMKTEIKGGLEDVLSLTTYLLVSAATRHHQGRNHRPGRAKRANMIFIRKINTKPKKGEKQNA